MSYSFYISHEEKHRGPAYTIAQILVKEFGLTMAPLALVGGWPSAAVDIIKHSELLIALLSHDSVKAKWAKFEINTALKNGVPILICRLPEVSSDAMTPPSGQLGIYDISSFEQLTSMVKRVLSICNTLGTGTQISDKIENKMLHSRLVSYHLSFFNPPLPVDNSRFCFPQKMRSPSLFLSYTHEDRAFALQLYEDLTEAGAYIWIDEKQVLVGDSLIEKIRKGIDSVDYLAVVISPASASSEWVRREVDVAMNQEISSGRVKVLPLLYRDCDLPGFLHGKFYADFRDSNGYEQNLRKLMSRLGLAWPTRQRRSRQRVKTNQDKE